jgi:hypothetical protein
LHPKLPFLAQNGLKPPQSTRHSREGGNPVPAPEKGDYLHRPDQLFYGMMT